LAIFGDPISLVEAAYRADADPGVWLNQLADAARSFDQGLGLIAFSGAIVPGYGIKLDANATRNMCSELEDALRANTEGDPALGARSVQQARSGATFSEAVGAEAARAFFTSTRHLGCEEMLGVTSIDPDGLMVGLSIALPKVGTLSRRERDQWDRLAAHIAAGHRLQRRLLERSTGHDTERDLEDAILHPDGRLEHASESAKTPSARASLRDAAIAMDRARSSLRRKDPDEALSLWRALVSGRWSLVDKFDSDGRRYLIAHKNDPRTRELAALTTREQQVTAYLALGHSNKRISYELGISESTVSEVGRRSLAKLGVSSRADLARLYAGNMDESEVPERAQ
jgi:DNA-binding CsgD family transcriptional regulator